ncbi:peptidylprolyl isomerase [Gammaproteobacteria bacterium 54_18_T64]|nr:peptidylprolyl isomerase [Gammaproteobacteria bacterium 54_18_T64]
MDESLIGNASRVTLHFALSLEDGSVIDSNFDQRPATLSMGDGNLPLGFEEHLLGMSGGQQGSFTVLPEKAFGQHNPSNIQHVKRSSFAADMALSEGLVVSFADANKGELPGVIQAIGEDEVTVDFNHPLAGKTLIFKVEIVAVDNTATEVQ